ncbi:DUF2244 domain-containing protein [Cognatishimia sp. SS12]|uniref:DUF2244 domain-containing protein n=1 Tax=Cognatishimia sp. SS12 TaxID=2979465 RepID=UPI00232CC3FB|nr:DUF2244 domain-containing protein [Cognatishimia sp. SS12]MDC0736839.1 DUF2244 domain-containing protein [Cognatishimia sp. SS12]
MPYHWNTDAHDPVVLTLTAHRSLPPRGFAAVILGASAMIALPLLGLLGTSHLWRMLPFLALAIVALWVALRRSYRDGTERERLERHGDVLTLTHMPVRGASKRWECNIYWARAEMHATGGPVPQYITLSGGARTVEIGRFLSEEERVALFKELSGYLARPGTPG